MRIFLAVTILLCLLQSVSQAEEKELSSCVKCHEETYVRAASYLYQHSPVKDKCAFCHIIQSAAEDKKGLRFTTSDLENLLYLENLRDDKSYQVRVSASGPGIKNSEPFFLRINPEDIKKYRDTYPPLKTLSGITVEEIKKGLTVNAVVSWDTDAYATSEIECSSSEKKPANLCVDDLLSRKHKLELRGLKHAAVYRCNIISRDISGNMIRSDELSINTSQEKTSSGKGEDNKTDTVIEDAKPIKITDKKGFYLFVTVSRTADITVSVSESQKIDDKHGNGLVPERFLKITVCYKCHTAAASHPVEVRAYGTKLRTPDDLPTIENGMLTCITCHYAHGGNAAYYAIEDFKKDICIKCHIESYK